jgi:hypothetical protein
MSGGRSVVGATVSGAGRAVSAAGARVPGTRWTDPGAGTTVSGEGTVPLSAESRHPEREFLDAPQKLVVVCWLANARDRGRGNSLDDAVGVVGRGVQLDLWMAGKSGLYFRGKPAGPDGSQEVVRKVRDEASEVPQELRRLAIAHLLERENPVSALLLERDSRFSSSVGVTSVGSRTPHRMFVVDLERAASSSWYGQDHDRRYTGRNEERGPSLLGGDRAGSSWWP